MKKTRLLGLVLVLMILVQMFANNPGILASVQVQAEGSGSPSQFITAIKVTDLAGNPLGTVTPTTSVKITYDYDVDNLTDASTYTFDLPAAVARPVALQSGTLTSKDEVFADYNIDVTGKITINFKEHVKSLSDVKGYFEVLIKFSEHPTGGPQIVDFDIGGSKTISITITFSAPDPVAPTITKKIKNKAALTTDSTKIEWEVTVDPGKPKPADLKVVDTLNENLQYETGSISVSPAESYTVDYTGKNLTIDFPALSQPVTITYTTIMTPTTSTPDVNKGRINVVYENVAKLYQGESTTPIATKSDKYEQTTKWIKKSGVKTGERTIEWTITVNEDKQSLPASATVTDALASYLTVIGTPQLKINNDAFKDINDASYMAVGTYSYIHPNIIYTFNQTTQDTYIIKFTTEINEAYFTQHAGNLNVPNTAVLKDYGLGTDLKGTASNGIGVGSAALQKQTVGSYNSATRELKWKITANQNKVQINSSMLTDTLTTSGQIIKDGTLIVTGGGKGWTLQKLADGEIPDSDGEYIYTPNSTSPTGFKLFLGDLVKDSDPVVVNFTSIVNNPDHYAGNGTVNHSNSSKLTGTNINDVTANANHTVTSNVIRKSNAGYDNDGDIGYDYTTHTFSWKITVNENKMPMSNATVTDMIQAGHAYVDGSLKIRKTSDTNWTNSVWNVEANGDLSFLINGGNLFTDTYEIKFKTKINDPEFFKKNQDRAFRNKAKLIFDAFEVEDRSIEVEATKTITNKLLDKTMIGNAFLTAPNYVDWSVAINGGQQTLHGAELTDKLEAFLELDTDTVKLYAGDVAPGNGNITKDTSREISKDQYHVSYNYETNEFKVTMPTPLTDAYVLEFRTYIRESGKSLSIQNTMSLKAESIEEKDDMIHGIEYISGGSASGTNGSVKIVKIDAKTGNPIPGAKFKITGGADYYGNIRTQVLETNINGEIVFERLKFEREYTISEAEPAPNYLPSDRTETFTIPSGPSADEKNRTYTFYNNHESNAADIVLYKMTSGNRPLGSAEFTLYDYDGHGNNLTAMSDSTTGEVIFNNIPTGTYIVKETKAPSGFIKFEETITVTVTAGSGGPATVSFNPSDTIINTAIPSTPFGSIIVNKMDGEGTALEGAKFELTNSLGHVLYTATSNSSGEARFGYVFFGSYTLRETSAPEGYVIDPQEVKVIVTSTIPLSYTFVNEKETDEIPAIKGELEVLKTDTAGTPLSGAEFGLYNIQGTLLTSAVSNSQGSVRFTDIAAGSYILKELRAPQGYLLNPQSVNVTVENNDVQRFTFENQKVTSETIWGSIHIRKIDENSSPLPGATFVLYNASGVAVQTVQSDSNGMVKFDNLPLGTYTIKETQSPEGYRLVTESKDLTVSSAKVQQLGFRNVPDDFPIDEEKIPEGWVDIENPDIPGGILPQAGFFMDTLFTLILGSLLILAGSIMLILRKRSSAR